VLAAPVGATVLAWLALDELPSAAFYVGAPLILAGVFVAAAVRSREETEEAASTPP
jgi:drug/metabolite transporter (DMT)-like permease